MVNFYDLDAGLLSSSTIVLGVDHGNFRKNLGLQIILVLYLHPCSSYATLDNIAEFETQ